MKAVLPIVLGGVAGTVLVLVATTMLPLPAPAFIRRMSTDDALWLMAEFGFAIGAIAGGVAHFWRRRHRRPSAVASR